MKIFGIFGDPIEHSLSPAMQNAAFRALGMDGCYQAGPGLKMQSLEQMLWDLAD